ncbi:tetratricopeptide repeat protein [Henriciella sp.]|uniref:tetratricopeptide repeat protein n=1 Tax=Henriciella sp. TaxID=1968823 RepID=UPI0025C6E822|nr:tetratricopeptide repeat protein [Henriciella sp.]
MGQIGLAAGLAALVVFAASAVNRESADPRPERIVDGVQDRMALALVHHELGNPNEARDALEAALRLDPDYAPALILMEEYRYRGPQAK